MSRFVVCLPPRLTAMILAGIASVLGMSLQTIRAIVPVESSMPSGGTGLEEKPNAHFRSILDRRAFRYHSLDGPLHPEPLRAVVRFALNERAVPIVRTDLPSHVLAYRASIPSGIRPHAGFRAPILDASGDLRPASIRLSALTPVQQKAAALVASRLPTDGLLAVLSRLIQMLGIERARQDPASIVPELSRIGFPVDMLAHFRLPTNSHADPAAIVSHIARMHADRLADSLLTERLREIEFAFKKTAADFLAAEEGGERDAALVRIQIGGGYDGGILRGGSIDVSGQLLAALPKASFLASVPEEVLPNIHWMARHSWPVRKYQRLKLISEPIRPAAWAQDNGKAGHIGRGGEWHYATITPRFASLLEDRSAFAPAESFLMDGLRAAGHSIIHSPLLFQGGNLLVIRDPKTGERLLLISETELTRNRIIGLTKSQALHAFEVEFGVQRCVVMPALSYHLDYDVTLRVHEGRVIAFVNDSQTAAIGVVRRGIQALEQHGFMTAEAAGVARTALDGADYDAAIRSLTNVLRPFRNARNQYSVRVARAFASDPEDFASYNFQCFLAAIDLLDNKAAADFRRSEERADGEYWSALRQLDETAAVHRQILADLGWTIVAVPSMPDLYRSINYLNGLHDRSRYLMPAIGGFYESLDEAAESVFQATLGAAVKIVPVHTAHIQQQHGALHCVASLFPSAPATPAGE